MNMQLKQSNIGMKSVQEVCPKKQFIKEVTVDTPVRMQFKQKGEFVMQAAWIS